MSPYQEAWQHINKHPGTGGAGSLAKLVLSFYNDACAFTFRECVSNLDSNLTNLAVRMTAHFAAHGEDADLRSVGNAIVERFPRLWDAGMAMDSARQALQRQWEREDEAKRRAEYPDE